jgi:hypothetical protein
MSQFKSATRAVALAALVSGYGWMCPATATADSNSAALAKLLSKGYDTSNCTAKTVSDALAEFECGQNSMSGGPTTALYVLYDDPSGAAGGFKELASTLSLVPCASGATVPQTWNDDSSSGKVECGTKSGAAGVVWTNDQNNMAALVASPASDAKSLYQWWVHNG